MSQPETTSAAGLQRVDELHGEIESRIKQARAICNILSERPEVPTDDQHAAWAAGDLLGQAVELLERLTGRAYRLVAELHSIDSARATR